MPQYFTILAIDILVLLTYSWYFVDIDTFSFFIPCFKIIFFIFLFGVIKVFYLGYFSPRS